MSELFTKEGMPRRVPLRKTDDAPIINRIPAGSEFYKLTVRNKRVGLARNVDYLLETFNTDTILEAARRIKKGDR